MKKTKKLFFAVLIVAGLFACLTISATAADTSAGDPTQTKLAADRLSASERQIYDALRNHIAKVAAGETTSTTVTLTSNLSALSWTKEELGCTIQSNGAITSAAKNAAENKIKEFIDHLNIALLSDIPNELYWYTRGLMYTCNYSVTSNQISTSSITFKFPVAQDYRASYSSSYTVSSTKVANAQKAFANARAIVEKYHNKSDVEKLTAYKNEIRSLSDYNGDAYKDWLNGVWDNNDPYQAIYVFDGNPSTKVVCEGFSKAFKYLCDLSDFENDVCCYIVASDTHMWNVVKIGSKNYIADITNTVSLSTVGQGLFLVGAKGSNAGRTYAALGSGSWRYSYENSQKDLFCDGYLKIASSSYHPVHTPEEGWSANDLHHWLECPCGTMVSKTWHSSDLPQNAATCTQKAVCDVCGTAYGKTAPHTYNQEVATETYLCLPASCVSAAKFYYSCACGATGTETFEHGDVAKGHDFSVRNISDDYLAIAATCTTRAQYYYSCACGAAGTGTFEFGEELGHTYDTWVSTGERWHRLVCICGSAAIVDPHSDEDTDGMCDTCNTHLSGDIDDQSTTTEAQTIILTPGSVSSEASGCQMSVAPHLMVMLAVVCCPIVLVVRKKSAPRSK